MDETTGQRCEKKRNNRKKSLFFLIARKIVDQAKYTKRKSLKYFFLKKIQYQTKNGNKKLFMIKQKKQFDLFWSSR